MRTNQSRRIRRWNPLVGLLILLGLMCVSTGCWAPFCSPGIPACTLPDSFRTPTRTAGPPLNYVTLTMNPQPDYILGTNDVLEVTVHGLYPGMEIRPLRAQLMANGDVSLPLVGAVRVGGLNLMQAHAAITKAYEDGFIKEPRINVYLVDKATTSVLVLGEVAHPGVYRLPKYENDVAHALAMAGGLREDAATEIEVHRRVVNGTGGAMPYRQYPMSPPAQAT